MRIHRVRMSRSRRPRSPVEWERFLFALATGAGSALPVETPIAAPLSFEPNLVDSNWTVRAIRLNILYRYTFSVRVADDLPLMCLGLYRKDINDPTIADASSPTNEDWLDLWDVQFVAPLAGDLHATPLIRGPVNQRSVKVMRKLDQKEAIFFTQTTLHFTAAQSAGFVGGVATQVSNLWSRSLRK